MVLRFANSIFEPIWNYRYVDHVQITVAEDARRRPSRGYYDKAGALRDMMQNHVFQLMALVAMEPPRALRRRQHPRREGEAAAPSAATSPRTSTDYVVRGQYGAGWVDGEEVAGYREEDGVAADSRTETYVALRVEIDNWRWAGRRSTSAPASACRAG